MKLLKKTQKLVVNDLTWKIAGEAGFGIATSGHLFSRVCSRAGLFLHSWTEYPSLIRGGHNTFQATIRDNRVFAPYWQVNMLIAFNKESITKHLQELSEKALIMFDPADTEPTQDMKHASYILCPVPYAQLAKSSGADRVMRNTVALGASIALLDFDMQILDELFKEEFASKGSEIIALNQRTARSGYEYIKNNFNVSSYPYRLSVNKSQNEKQLILTGNDALGLGALKSGVKFYAGYPMTPATTLLQFMAAHQVEYDLVVKHTEDEISAALMAIGASYAGVRSLTASSGGGFCLMVESLGLAAIIEVPMVYIDVQRPGPATGLPTWTDQSDLQFVLHASQGEFPRIVVAPGDTDECFYVLCQAFNIAEKYQLPVIILSDRFLAESTKSTAIFDESKLQVERGKLVSQMELDRLRNFKRYDTSPQDGVSARSIPGLKGGIYLANSDEHDEYGFTNEEAAVRINMQTKRLQKFISASVELPEPVLHGPRRADHTIIAWGSTKGIILEAMKLLEEEGMIINFLQILYLSPFPAKAVSDVIETSKSLILIENNMTAQLGSIITEHTGLEIINKILKFDGRPFYPEELAEKILSMKPRKGVSKWLQ